MSYSFEDNSDDGAPDGGKVETSAHLTRGGVPRWVMAILGVGALALFLSARGDLGVDEAAQPPATAPSFGFPTTTDDVPDSETTSPEPDVLVTSPPDQLTHQDLDWPVPSGGGVGRSIAVRSGSTVLIIDPVTETAHRIELPVTTASQARDAAGFDSRTMALVADKLITYDDGFLRSLSTRGGVDVLLSNSSLGFEVSTPTAIVAATQVISSSAPEPEIRLVPQGVHFPSARDQVVSVFGEPDLDLLPPGAAVSVIDAKIFVRLNGEIHRKTSEGLVSLNTRRVFAASENAAIIERCVALFENCSYFRVNLADLSIPEVELFVPLSFSRSRIVMDADGWSIIVLDDGSEEQTLVDISTGEWNVAHQFSGDRFTAATFDSVSESWILAYPQSLVFWNASDQVFWQLTVLGEIDEIAIAQRLG